MKNKTKVHIAMIVLYITLGIIGLSVQKESPIELKGVIDMLTLVCAFLIFLGHIYMVNNVKQN